MTLLILYFALLIIALLIVIKAADLFVDNIVKLGEAIGVSQIILGITVSAIGTSLPEFGSALIATLSGNPDIGVGVVIGSNIWNIAGILGISSFVAGYIATNREEINRDGLMTLITSLILMGFLIISNELTRISGIILIIAYLIYLWILIKAQKSKSKNNDINNKNTHLNKKNALFLIVGLLGLIIGSRILVLSGVELAHILNIPEILIGLFALGIGTSAPELVVTLTSAMKKHYSLSFGTILGSNIFNILIGIGLPVLFVNIPIEPLSVTFDAPMMIFVTVLLLLLSRRKMKLTRYGGLVLIIVYIIYVTIRIYLSLYRLS